MNPSSNFLSYRATLKAAISRSEGATDQRQRIVIPFFSLLVKDLLVVNEVSLIKTLAENCDSKVPSVGDGFEFDILLFRMHISVPNFCCNDEMNWTMS